MAGSKKDAFENAILLLIFNNVNIAGIGDAGGLLGSADAGNIYVGLLKVLPGENTQGTETTYTGYQRVAVPRTAAGWTVVGNNAYNADVVTFPVCGVVGDTIVGFAVYKSSVVGTDDALYYGEILKAGNPFSQQVVEGGIPEFAAGDINFYED